MSHQRNLKLSLDEPISDANSLKECHSTPYKRRKQTSQALEALGQLFMDSSVDDLDNNKLNKNDILSLTLSRLLRRKYWSSDLADTNVQLATSIQSSSVIDELKGFIIVVNTAGRIIFISDNVEYYLRKNVRLLYPQLISIYDCISKNDHDTIRQILSTPTLNENRAICNWILPRGKRPNRSNTETKSMALTGHFFFNQNDESKEPLFVARCEQILSSTPNIPINSMGLTSTTILRFVLTDQLNISEISSNMEFLLGFKPNELIDQSIHRILSTESCDIIEQAKQNCLSNQHATSMSVLDLFTRDGDRLTFLCNTHTLIEGRSKRIKLGFLAQLIDPFMRYQCLSYVNRQNVERRKGFIQQESMCISHIILNNSTATNVSMPPNDQCLSMANSPKSKPQIVNYQYVEKENYGFFNQPQYRAQVPFETNFKNEFSPSKTQEVGYIDDLFNWLDEENKKPKNKVAVYDIIHDVFDLDHGQDFGLLTPTISEINFF
ncbi:unnamed protein product [Rotaria socialis]|uniref:PAS domain-containing protein n=1 Tax=Rotaria socialis TaxID=392032 RepID=A0A818BBY5_9BILA|nr:unnamed protein product [Rotaria socialis]CAF3414236.1 unnamed protein product [Rotaria socialis]CAF3434906.1 unnamed protein product [Rotaria socialis]CAF3456559.1 unnamed protein product [Rotaria socialis]CAF3746980.1 unnamed protein product [Rotaria socialis]